MEKPRSGVFYTFMKWVLLQGPAVTIATAARPSPSACMRIISGNDNIWQINLDKNVVCVCIYSAILKKNAAREDEK